jgi:hypothetical protein
MCEVHRVTVQLRSPSGTDPGQVTFGFFVIEDGRLVMTDENGVKVRKKYGDLYTHVLKPEDDPHAIAGILTRKIREQVYGDAHNVWRRIDWPKNFNCV